MSLLYLPYTAYALLLVTVHSEVTSDSSSGPCLRTLDLARMYRATDEAPLPPLPIKRRSDVPTKARYDSVLGVPDRRQK